MKKEIFPIFLTLLIPAISNAQFVDSYWTGNTGTTTTSGWGSTSNVENWSTGVAPDANTNVIFNPNQLTGRKLSALTVEDGFVCNNYTIEEGYSAGHQIRLSGTMTVNGNFTVKNASTDGFALLANGSSQILTIGGSLNVGIQGDITNIYRFRIGENTSNQWGGWGGPKNVTIGGDINLSETSNLQFNVNLLNRVADYSAPDIDIKGTINFNGNGSKNPNLNIINAAKPYYSKDKDGNTVTNYSKPVEVVMASNGIIGNGVITNDSNGSLENGKGKAIILLRNTGNCQFNGWVLDGVNATTKIVMNGTGKQILTSGNTEANQGLAFTGGLEIISGTLEMSYTHQINHGDLTMKGGRLMNISGNSSKNINFSDFIYDGGTLVSRWNGSALDIITLTGGIYKGFDCDKFLLEISGDLSSMLNIETKLVSWDNTTNTTDFVGEDFILTNGEANFTIKDDGLYVTVTAVPEPSTLAAILGAIALGLAFRRRL